MTAHFRCIRTWLAYDPASTPEFALSRTFTTGEEHAAPEWIARILARAGYVVILSLEVVGQGELWD